MDALNARGVPVRGAKLLVLGVTYKPDVGDIRESAAIQVMAHLSAWGAKLSFHDPFVKEIDEHGMKLRRRRLTDELVAESDATLLLTPHASYDVRHICDIAQLVFDARNATGARHRANVEVL